MQTLNFKLEIGQAAKDYTFKNGELLINNSADIAPN